MLTTYKYSIIDMTYLTNRHLQLIAHPITTPMHYGAGQYLMIRYPSGEFMPFSVANAPTANRHIELHIRISAQDLATQAFVEDIKETGMITFKGPYGDCQYKSRQGPLLLLAAGTGFAPAKAIIEAIMNIDKMKECYFYWTVKRPDDFYLPELPHLWKKNLTNFHYQLMSTLSEDEKNKSNILEAVINDFSDLSPFQIYLFGPPTLALDALKKFTPHGLTIRHFFTDVLSIEQIRQHTTNR